jgi:hypothetical protein
MAQRARSISLSVELDSVIAMLASSKGQNYSQFLEFQLRDIGIIKEMIHRLETVPDLPPMIKGNIPKSTKPEKTLTAI